MITDPIADLLTRIRNANMRCSKSIEAPFSNLKWQISQVLKEEGYIKTCEQLGEKSAKKIKITLKYTADKKQVISVLRRISKPGRRVYAAADDLKRYQGGFGVILLSTPKGVITDKSAYQQKVGGEVLFSIW